ncbi:MAG: CAP domain-containing protein [Candidatus Sumerlaeota bacterium]|nr:CAP domain-containing protein [Candidatus Sumerlaeota bacterium]
MFGNCKGKLRAAAAAAKRSFSLAFALAAAVSLIACYDVQISVTKRGSRPAPLAEQAPSASLHEAQTAGVTQPPLIAQPSDAAQADWLAREAGPETFDARRLEAEAARLSNEMRRQNGRAELAYSARLAHAARAHSEEMARLGYLSHESPAAQSRTVADRLREAGLGYHRVAENISWQPCWAAFWSDGRKEAYMWAQVAANAVRRWSESPGHRENLLRAEVSEFGLGAAIALPDGRPYVYLTQVFRQP